MRRALAAAGVVGALALTPVAPQPAQAQAPEPATRVLAADPLEPASSDGDDDTAKYGLIGLTGMFGLLGYRKVKEHRATRSTRDRAPGPAGTGGTSSATPIGDVDDDASGSRRI